MKKIIVCVFLTALFMGSCSSYTISKESLVTQLKEKQEVLKTSNLLSLGTDYYSNNLQKIQCIDANGHNVYLYAGKNMNFVMTNASTGKKVHMYFDTVYIKNDTLFGLKSRILGGKRQVAVNDVSKIAINAESAKVEFVPTAQPK